MQVIVIHSGGLDSTVLLYHLLAEGAWVRALSVDYGQRHRDREHAAAEAITRTLGIERRVVDLRGMVEFFAGSSLTDTTSEIPLGAYAEASMKRTTVPNRNMILISLGLAWAAQVGAEATAYGAHTGEYTPYPDCRPEFAAAMDSAAQRCDWRPLRVLAPFATWDKSAIVRRGAALGVPFAATWSCYLGGAVHCGKCGTCLDRRTAFLRSGVHDPTAYADC